MKPTNKCIEFIKEFEGFSSTAYRCPAGVWTIGYGQTKNVKRGDTITEKEASDDLYHTVCDLFEQMSKYIKVNLNSNQVDAVTSFTYNVGIGAFSKSTLIKRINSNDMSDVEYQLSRWNKAGGKILNGLVTRRKMEADLFNEPLTDTICSNDPVELINKALDIIKDESGLVDNSIAIIKLEEVLFLLSQ